MIVKADGTPQVGKPSNRIRTAVDIGSCRSSMYCPRRTERLCWFIWRRKASGPSFLLSFWRRKVFGTRFGCKSQWIEYLELKLVIEGWVRWG